MKKFIILDTGVYRADPYVIVNELQEAVAQSVEKNGGHYAHGLREITDYIAALESRLREAEAHIKEIVVSLPNDEIEIARSSWGNTNTAIIKTAIQSAAAFLAGGDTNKV